MYHDFKAEADTGPVLLGEASMCNGDENDNRFYEATGRFPAIEEDAPPYRLLCMEYPKAITGTVSQAIELEKLAMIAFQKSRPCVSGKVFVIAVPIRTG